MDTFDLAIIIVWVLAFVVWFYSAVRYPSIPASLMTAFCAGMITFNIVSVFWGV